MRIKYKGDGTKLGQYFKKYVEQIGLLYMVEAENIKLHRTVDEIKLRRSRPDVTKILAALHFRIEKILKNGKHLHYGDLMNKALTYMLNDWDELQNYRMDGHYTIDHMIAECVIRPFTVNRKNSLFYSSEQGVDVGYLSYRNRKRKDAWT